jgi:predicted DNA-binding transcriptional regulator YafY
MELTDRQGRILAQLRMNDFVTIEHLVRATFGVPAASIRRDIGALRKKGYDIGGAHKTGKGYYLHGEAFDIGTDAGDEDDNKDWGFNG